MCGGSECNTGIGFSLLLCLRQGLLASVCAKLAGPGACKGFPVSASHLAPEGMTDMSYRIQPLHGLWDLHSGPHMCALPTEPSSQLALNQSFCLHLSSSEIIGVHHQVQFIQCWQGNFIHTRQGLHHPSCSTNPWLMLSYVREFKIFELACGKGQGQERCQAGEQ